MQRKKIIIALAALGCVAVLGVGGYGILSQTTDTTSKSASADEKDQADHEKEKTTDQMDDVKDDAALINGAATDTVAADTSAPTVDTNSSTPAGNTGSSSYETKTIPAKTHHEEEIVKQVCNGCGAQFDTAREAGLHTLASDTCENYTSKVVGTVIITDVPATTQQVYIGKKMLCLRRMAVIEKQKIIKDRNAKITSLIG